jgi:antitoxin (DNA-binding transcriptional repressor) of toxin-antitoxin stability system
MDTTSVREFRSRLAEVLEAAEPVIITRHGKQVAIVFPLLHPENVPVEVRRSIVNAMGAELFARPRWPSASPTIERYKLDVDRTLIRENLRRTPEQRLQGLQSLQNFADELRRAR